jgi:predicted Zn-dependent protease
MYARGELYPQAIAETRAALAEDPQRLDLQVLLARLYYQADQKVEATEVCSSLLSKLPFCYEANLILTEILPGTSRADDSHKFQQRIYMLDPYAAFVTPNGDPAPEQAVMVERFVWDSSLQTAEKPEWARTVGVQWEETEEEQLPDWLGAVKPEQPTAGDPHSLVETPEAAATGDDLIPDWMKDAGWGKSDRPADEVMQEAYASEAEEGDIAPADIPDWMKSMAPPEASQDSDDERSNWLASILDEPGGEDGQSATGELQPTSLTLDSEASGEETAIPDWLAGLQPDEEAPPTVDAAGDVPDWLTPQAQEPSTEAEAVQPGADSDDEFRSAFSASDQETPDWLKSFEDEVSGVAAASEMGAGTDAPTDEREQDVLSAEETTAASDTPDWLRSFAEGEEAPAHPAEEAESTTGWFQSLESNEEAVETTPAGDVPDWLNALDENTMNLPGIPESPAAETAAPDWLQSQDTQEAELEQPAERDPIEASAPEWIQSIESSETAQPADLPDWLAEEAPGMPEQPAAEQENAIAEGTGLEPGEPQAMPDLASMDMDEAMAWLEGLAAKQGADEDTLLISRPEDRGEAPPDWLSEIQQQEGSDAAQAAVESQPEIPAEDLPNWLQDSEEATPASIGAVEPATWETSEPEPSPEEAPAVPGWAEETQAQEETETVPDWLSSMEEPKAEMEAGSAVASQQVGIPAEGQAEDLPFDMNDPAAAMAWLEALAARQGADEETLVTRPEERPQNLAEEPSSDALESFLSETEAAYPAERPDETDSPEWLTPADGIQATAEAGEQLQPEAAQETPGYSPETPDWLPAEEAEAPLAAQPEMGASAAEDAVPDFTDMDAAMAWLEGLAAKHGADEETLVTAPEDRLEAMPDWLKQEVDASEEGANTEQPAAMEQPAAVEQPAAIDQPEIEAEQPAAELPQGETPEQVRLSEDEERQLHEVEERLEAERQRRLETLAQEEQTLPDWLQDAVEIEPADADEEELPAQAPSQPETAEWETPEPALEQETPAAAASPEAQGEMDMDDAFAWLEALAAKQGADEATLVNAPEDRLETAPEWVKEQQAAGTQEEAQAAQAMPETDESEPEEVNVLSEREPGWSSEPVPDWLNAIETETPAMEEPAAAQSWQPDYEPESLEPAVAEEPVEQETEALPDWLRQPAEDSGMGDDLPAPDQVTPDAAEEQAVPSWLKDLENEEQAQEAVAFPVMDAYEEPEVGAPLEEISAAWVTEMELEPDETHDTTPAPTTLAEAQVALNRGRIASAMEVYNRYIQNGENIDETIHDLRDALYRYPVDINIWQALGDAYARNNQLQEALDAYTKAEELLR